MGRHDASSLKTIKKMKKLFGAGLVAVLSLIHI